MVGRRAGGIGLLLIASALVGCMGTGDDTDDTLSQGASYGAPTVRVLAGNIAFSASTVVPGLGTGETVLTTLEPEAGEDGHVLELVWVAKAAGGSGAVNSPMQDLDLFIRPPGGQVAAIVTGPNPLRLALPALEGAHEVVVRAADGMLVEVSQDVDVTLHVTTFRNGPVDPTFSAVPRSGANGGSAQVLPEAVPGFTVTPLAPLSIPTAIAFGPGDDGPDLYATTVNGGVYSSAAVVQASQVLRMHLDWTAAGPVVVGTSVVADGFDFPAGIAFDADGTIFVADHHDSEHPYRTMDGVVYMLQGGEHVPIVDNLPNGLHNTNHIRFGPDGRLYIANGNPNNNGKDVTPEDGGATPGRQAHLNDDPLVYADDVFPYSGAVLAVDVDAVREEPAVFDWFDEDHAPIAEDEVGGHPLNDDFAEKVEVVGHGFRNIYGLAFGPDGHVWTAMNGANGPDTQDVLYRLDEEPGTFYGFPHCFDRGPPGGTGNQVRKETSELFPDVDCTDVPTADAMLGWFTCATGLDFPTGGAHAFQDMAAGRYAGSVYVGECFALEYGENLRSLGDPSTHSTSHKVVRVELDAFGQPQGVHDFVTGLPAPIDVVFGPEGAMYIASVEGIHRVAPVA